MQSVKNGAILSKKSVMERYERLYARNEIVGKLKKSTKGEGR